MKGAAADPEQATELALAAFEAKYGHRPSYYSSSVAWGEPAPGMARIVAVKPVKRANPS
jgi:hypothetical protein